MSKKNNELCFHVDQLIERDKILLIESVRDLVKIRSVAGKQENDNPFGPGPAEALKAVLEIAGNMGFLTKNLDNYVGFAEYGVGKDYIAVLGHLDTVPEGENWSLPPLGGSLHNGRIFGRGALDDKGPILSALYGLKALRDSGIPLTRRIRIIFGTDEETGDLDIAHYLSVEKPPVCGFTPDSDFPVVFAEKGILHVDLTGKIPPDNKNPAVDHLISLTGGTAVNMVPDRAVAEIRTGNPADIISKCMEFSRTSGYSISAQQNRDIVIIRSEGVSSHGSKPHLGKNAVMQLSGFLSTLQYNPAGACDMIRFLEEKIGVDTTGVSLGLGLIDELSGHLTLNAGLVRYNGGELVLSLDIRYPVTIPVDSVILHIREALKGRQISITVKKHQPPLYFPPESELIRTLTAIYHEVTGDNKGPVAIGGGTYARRMPNIVAFGPYFPGKVYNIHAPDESIDCEDLVTITKIYARAMYNLAR
jgi:succinyl-diaminopimelate desuccinylase